MNAYKYIIVLLVAAMTLALSGCEFDNFDPPSSAFTGQIVYNGEAIGLRSTGVQLELWQDGYDDFEKIPVHVDQDGSFSAMLFDGDYKLTFLNNNGPWVGNTDTTLLTIKGNTQMDLEVEPYYTIGDASFSVNGSNVEATFTVNEVNSSLSLLSAQLLIGATTIVDAVRREGVTRVNSSQLNVGGSNSASIEMPEEIVAKGYVFARVGLQIAGSQELIYTPVMKLEF